MFTKVLTTSFIIMLAMIGASSCDKSPVAPEPEKPMGEVVPSALIFSTVEVGESEELTFTITNVGGGQLKGTVAENSRSYSLQAGAGSYILGPGQSRTVTVKFTPKQAGDMAGEILTGDGCGDVSCSGVGRVPPSICIITPQTLDFESVEVGKSKEMTFVIENRGRGTMTGTVAINSSEFSILAGAGLYSLEMGQQRTVKIRFSPASVGSKSVSITTGTACGDVSCTGTAAALPLACEITPLSLSFLPVELGQTAIQFFTIANTGEAVLNGEVAESSPHFFISGGGGSYSLAAGERHIVTVGFAPTSAGAKSVTIQTGTTCGDVICSGTGTDPNPTCEVTPQNLDFGSLEIGQSTELTFSIKNTGRAKLSGVISENSSHYSIIAGRGMFRLDQGQSHRVLVRFAPTSVGTKSITILTGPSCPDVSCSGEGSSLAPVCEIMPTNLSFGSVEVGRSEEMTFTIKNAGQGTLSGVVSEGSPDYSIVNGIGLYSLEQGQSRVVRIRFIPTSAGLKTTSIQTGTECGNVSCSGTGTESEPSCFVTPADLDFGSVEGGLSKDMTFAIQNIGGGTLNGVVSEASSHYAIVSGSGSYALTQGESKTIKVRFAPMSAGPKPTTIRTGTVCGDVSCTGTGTEPVPSCSVTPQNLSFGSVEVGQAEEREFTIKNIGRATLNGVVSENSGQYSIVAGSGLYSLGQGQSITVRVRFSPTTDGPKSVAIQTGTRCGSVSCAGTGTAVVSETALYIWNNTSHFLVSIKVNGRELLPGSGNAIGPGRSVRVANLPGEYQISIENGFWEFNTSKKVLNVFPNPLAPVAVSLNAGETKDIKLMDPPINEKLTWHKNGQESSYWEGIYFTGFPVQSHVAKVRFRADGTYDFWVDSDYRGRFAYQHQSYTAALFTYMFKVGGFDATYTETDPGTVNIKNGPPDFPWIAYTYQRP